MNGKGKSTHNMLNPNASKKSIYFWNMMGSLVNATTYMVLLMFVTRICGEYDGGVFALAYSISVLMWSIGSFEMGPYQVTDTRDTFAFGHYLAMKIVLCIGMMIISFVVAFARGGSAYEIATIIIVCVYKMFDAFSGVFYSQFQKYGRLDVSGWSLCCRVFLSILIFAFVLFIRRSLISAMIAACAVEVVWIVGYEMRRIYPIYGLKPKFEYRKLAQLLTACIPLFIGTFLVTFLTNLPKYAIDAYYEIRMQAAVGTLFTPAAIINLLSLFVFRPSLTTLAAEYANQHWKGFLHRIKWFMGIIGAFTILAMLFAWSAGTQVLGIIYGVSLREYRAALVIIMLGGGFSALTTFLNYILTIMRKQSFVLLGNLLSVVVSLCICSPLVKAGAVNGAAVLYMLSMLLAGVSMLSVVMWAIRKSAIVE